MHAVEYRDQVQEMHKEGRDNPASWPSVWNEWSPHLGNVILSFWPPLGTVTEPLVFSIENPGRTQPHWKSHFGFVMSLAKYFSKFQVESNRCKEETHREERESPAWPWAGREAEDTGLCMMGHRDKGSTWQWVRQRPLRVHRAFWRFCYFPVSDCVPLWWLCL